MKRGHVSFLRDFQIVTFRQFVTGGELCALDDIAKQNGRGLRAFEVTALGHYDDIPEPQLNRDGFRQIRQSQIAPCQFQTGAFLQNIPLFKRNPRYDREPRIVRQRRGYRHLGRASPIHDILDKDGLSRPLWVDRRHIPIFDVILVNRRKTFLNLYSGFRCSKSRIRHLAPLLP